MGQLCEWVHDKFYPQQNVTNLEAMHWRRTSPFYTMINEGY